MQIHLATEFTEKLEFAEYYCKIAIRWRSVNPKPLACSVAEMQLTPQRAVLDWAARGGMMGAIRERTRWPCRREIITWKRSFPS